MEEVSFISDHIPNSTNYEVDQHSKQPEEVRQNHVIQDRHSSFNTNSRSKISNLFERC